MLVSDYGKCPKPSHSMILTTLDVEVAVAVLIFDSLFSFRNSFTSVTLNLT